MNENLQCLYAFIGCLGFTFIFRSNRYLRFGLVGALLGTLGFKIYLSFNYLDNVFLQNFIAMLTVSIFSELLARLFKAPATLFIVVGCFPLVPGSGIYDTMLFAVLGNNEAFINSFVTTLGIGISLAFAILISSTIFRMYKIIKTHDYANIE